MRVLSRYFRFKKHTLQHSASILLGLLLMACPLGAHTSQAETHSFTRADYYRLSREASIVSALELMASQPNNTELLKTLENLQTHKAAIMFRDLAEFGPQFAGDDALTLIDKVNGQQLIYIHSKHEQAAPPQALAALIAHEAIHHDQQNSVAEEVSAWHIEASVWKQMRHNYPALSTISPRQSLLVDRLNALLILDNRQQLTQHVQSLPGYQQLPKQ